MRMIVRRRMFPVRNTTALVSLGITSAACVAALCGLLFWTAGNTPGRNVGLHGVDSLPCVVVSVALVIAHDEHGTFEAAQVWQREIERLLKCVRLPLTPCDVRADDDIVAFRDHPSGSTRPTSPTDELTLRSEPPTV
jgi:hypothetical protein